MIPSHIRGGTSGYWQLVCRTAQTLHAQRGRLHRCSPHLGLCGAQDGAEQAGLGQWGGIGQQRSRAVGWDGWKGHELPRLCQPRISVLGCGLIMAVIIELHLLSTCYVPGTILSAFSKLSHLILVAALWGRWRNWGWVTRPRSQS